MEETRKINHHGKVREVANNEKEKEKSSKDPIILVKKSGFNKNQGHGNKVAFGNLVNVDERIQDKALKEFYSTSVVKNEKIMNACIFFSRKIKIVIIISFVFIYWGSGLYRSTQME